MEERDDLLLGNLAIQKGYISREQLIDALRVQGSTNKPLGVILVNMNLLTTEQLVELVENQKQAIDKEQGIDMFGQVVVQKEYATYDQVLECHKEQQELLSQGVSMQIGQLLLKKRYITTDQFLDVMRLQNKTVMKCPTCDLKYTIYAYQEGKKFTCRQCKKTLIIPSRITDIKSMVELTVEEQAKPQRDLSAPAFNRIADSPVLDEQLESQPKEQAFKVTSQLSGKRFGKYDIVDQIGKGGMGFVFKSLDKDLNRIVALKVLKDTEGMNQTQIKRFIREAQIMARLKHPNIVSIHDVGVENGLHYFVMDYVEGCSLEDVIEGKKLPMRTLVSIMEKVARAVNFAHANGVIHRDLKPSNILLDNDLNPFVTDFGLAKTIDTKSRFTRSGAALGTPYYMSPEQAKGTEDIDERSDVYSLGVILYETLTHKLPFHGDSLMEIYNRIINFEPERPRRMNKNIPIDLETIIIKSMEKDRLLRYQSAEALADDSKRYLEGEPILARPPSMTTVITRYARKNRFRLVSVTSVIIIAILTFVYFIIIRKEQERRGNIEVQLHSTHQIRDALAESRDLLEKARLMLYQEDSNVIDKMKRLIDQSSTKLKDIVQKTPQWEAFYLLGKGCFLLEQLKEAEGYLNKSISQNPSMWAYLLRSRVRIEQYRLKMNDAKNMENHLRKLKEDEAKEMLANARADVEEGLKGDLKDQEKLYYQVVIEYTKSNYDATIGLCKKLLDAATLIEKEQVYMLMGDSYIHLPQPRYSEAERSYSDAIKACANMYKAYISRAGIRFKNLKITEAIQDLSRAIDINPKYASAYQARSYYRAWLCNNTRMTDLRARLSELEGAVQDAETAQNLIADPTNYSIHLTLAAAYLYCAQVASTERQAMEMFEKAITYYSKAIELVKGLRESNQSTSSDGALGHIHGERGFAKMNKASLSRDRFLMDEAGRDLEQAIKLNPTNAAPYVNLGGVRVNQERYEEAIKCYDKSIELLQINTDQDRQTKALRLLFRSGPKLRLAKFDEALADLNEAESIVSDLRKKNVELNPQVTNIYLTRANVYVYKRDLKSAIADYSAVINEFRYQTPDVYYVRGGCYHQIRDYDNAYNDMKNALELNERFKSQPQLQQFQLQANQIENAKKIIEEIEKIREKEY